MKRSEAIAEEIFQQKCKIAELKRRIDGLKEYIKYHVEELQNDRAEMRLYKDQLRERKEIVRILKDNKRIVKEIEKEQQIKK